MVQLYAPKNQIKIVSRNTTIVKSAGVAGSTRGLSEDGRGATASHGTESDADTGNEDGQCCVFSLHVHVCLLNAAQTPCTVVCRCKYIDLSGRTLNDHTRDNVHEVTTAVTIAVTDACALSPGQGHVIAGAPSILPTVCASDAVRQSDVDADRPVTSIDVE